MEKQKQEKIEMEKYYLSKLNQAPVQINNTEENISDLILLANEELERKSKIINELLSRVEYLEGNNLENMDEKKLTQLKDFYGNKLSSIVSQLSK